MGIRVLGSLAAFADGADVTPTSPNQRTVLAVLAAHPDQDVRADTLIDALWGSDPPQPPSAPSAAADTLRSALDLWHGHAFGELADLDAVSAQARTLEQLKVGAREQLAEAWLKSGDFAAAVAESESLLADLPLDESAWEILIRALSGGSRTAEALDAYRRAYESLSAVGLEPSERLTQAQRDAFDAPAPAPPQPIAPPAAHDLFGRDDDLAALAAIIDCSQLVTIVGPGGVGKTTLAARSSGAARPPTAAVRASSSWPR
jgi:DNA-binding SARP family transcriptional activator